MLTSSVTCAQLINLVSLGFLKIVQEINLVILGFYSLGKMRQNQNLFLSDEVFQKKKQVF